MNLKDIANVTTGYTQKKLSENTPGNGVYLVTLKDIMADGLINWSSVDKVIGEPEHLDKFSLHEGDLFINSKGSNREVVFVDSSIPQNTSFVVTSNFFRIRLKDNSIMPEFLHWWMRQKPAMDFFSKESLLGNTTSIRKQTISMLSIPSISIEEQKDIVAMYKEHLAQKRIMERINLVNQEIYTAIATEIQERHYDL